MMLEYSMVQECTDRYEARELPDGGLEVVIRAPARFRDLWLARLSALRTTNAEIRAYEPEPPERRGPPSPPAV